MTVVSYLRVGLVGKKGELRRGRSVGTCIGEVNEEHTLRRMSVMLWIGNTCV